MIIFILSHIVKTFHTTTMFFNPLSHVPISKSSYHKCISTGTINFMLE
uniref:Uncharacterized protein n=1 Tax=Arundo donax TaxID=35708 RepID=A0A0A9A0Y5_ARUDO